MQNNFENETRKIVNQLLFGKNKQQILEYSERSGVQLQNITAWQNGRPATFDLLAKLANTAGFDIIAVKRKRSYKMTKIKVLSRNNRQECFIENHLVGYVENETLYGIDRKGFAVEITSINHRTEIIGKLEEWRKSNLVTGGE